MPPLKPTLTHEEAGIGEQRNRVKRDRELELADMGFILSDPRGRRFIMRYLDFCGWRKTSFTGNNSETFLLEGQRNIAIKMMDDIMETSNGNDSFLTMLKESKGEPNA